MQEPCITTKHFYSKEQRSGIALRNESVASVKEKIEEKMNAYTLTVSARDGEETINASDIGLKYDDKKELDDLFKRKTIFVVLMATSEEEIDLDISVDEQKLDDEIQKLSCMQDENMTAPTDAHLEYSDGEIQDQWMRHMEISWMSIGRAGDPRPLSVRSI